MTFLTLKQICATGPCKALLWSHPSFNANSFNSAPIIELHGSGEAVPHSRGILRCNSYRESGFNIPREFKSCLDVSPVLFISLLSPGLIKYLLERHFGRISGV